MEHLQNPDANLFGFDAVDPWVEHWRYQKVQVGEKHVYLSLQLLFPKAVDHGKADGVVK